MKPQIAIVFTGGTISMEIDPQSGGPVPALSGREILRRVPALSEVAAIEVIDFGLCPGPHMTPDRMWMLREVVAGLLGREVNTGVVVTHGTDTLEESAYLLDLTIESEKPVVFAGAMRHSSELSWDGPANLHSAVRVAAAPVSRGLGVLVVMNETILAAADAIKTHTEDLNTFEGRDFGALGRVERDRIVVDRHPRLRPRFAAIGLEQRVEIIKLAAGSDGRLIDLVVLEGARGLVIEALGCGNVPPACLGPIGRALATGIPVVVTTRCPRGRVVDVYAYQGSGRDLRHLGAILGGFLPSHKARLKLMLLLGAKLSLEGIRQAFEAEDA